MWIFENLLGFLHFEVLINFEKNGDYERPKILVAVEELVSKVLFSFLAFL